MVAVDLPAPGLCCRGLAHDREPVEPLAIALEVVQQLRDVLVEAHDVAGGLETFRAQGSLKQAECGPSLLIIHLAEADPLPPIAVGVAPSPPLTVINRIQCGIPLGLGECRREAFSRFAN